ncbi:MAG: hypothetical protein OHK0029_06400 [Armatimonadaceae bacterium]
MYLQDKATSPIPILPKAPSGVRRVVVRSLPLMLLPAALLLAPGSVSTSRAQENDPPQKNRNFVDLTPKMKAYLESLPERERKGIELLRRMITEGLKRSFIAREVEIRSRGGEREQWVRWSPRQGMRRESIRPAGAIFLDNLRKSYFFDPEKKQWLERDSVMPKPEGRIGDTLRKLYMGELKATLDGEDKVAGRDADIVRVGPPPGSRGMVRRFWVDRKTGIRLKSEEIAPDGRVVATSYFLSVDFSPKFRPDDFRPPENAIKIADKDRKIRTYRSLEEARAAGVTPPQPEYLPDGFSLRVIEVGDSGGRHERVTVRYGNGIAVISLVRTKTRHIPRPIREQLGKDNAGFIKNPKGEREKIFFWTEGEWSYWLLGPITEEQIKRVANSVR